MIDSTPSALVATKAAELIVQAAQPPLACNIVPPTDSLATTLAAWSGAIVSLLLLGFEIFKHIRNKARIGITISFDQEIIGIGMDNHVHHLEEGKTFWRIHVVNSGEKPITLSQLGLDNKNKKHAIITQTYEGAVEKFELLPGKDRDFTIDYELAHPKNVKAVFLADTIGKYHRKNVHYKETDQG